ncbi:MAG: undecaprenyl/decaprenyl-phosphate alpha-N-acetylglucosaminyl 1-phosphate transferase [Acidobacteriia bacterium]|nr:undecaprenyl/decaprenyl-phosphate alpha-N-acetylglucosaminyl 1-phosphate transferase [Terriglobia bacterium]
MAVQFVVFLLLSIVVAAVLTRIVRDLANRYGLVSRPESARHLHTRAIPRLGGVALLLTFITVFGGYLFVARYGLASAPAADKFVKLVLPAVVLFIAGLVDDLKGLNAPTKLLIEIAGGASLYFGGMGFTCFQWSGADPAVNSAICLLATVFWVVLICNAMNLIDGLDGLAAGASLFSMVTIFTLALIGQRPGVAMATVVMGGALVGFLVFNFSPASIFLGDSGSLFLGFMLSGFVMAESQSQKTITSAVLVPVIAFALPLTDTAMSVLRRFLSGHSLFGADREHIHHKLLDLGLTHRQAVWILYGVSAMFAVLSLFIFVIGPNRLLFIPAVFSLVFLLFFGLRRLGYHEFAEARRIWHRAAWQKELMARNIEVRKIAARLRTTTSFPEALNLLESCLRGSFDGFEIVLLPEWAHIAFPGQAHQPGVKRFWNETACERMLFSFALSTAASGTVGCLSLYRSLDADLPIDVDFFEHELRGALGRVLETASHISPESRPVSPFPPAPAATRTTGINGMVSARGPEAS